MSEDALGESSHYLKSFSDINKKGDVISGVEFEDCTFVRCDFSDASFAKCRFISCSFSECDFNHAHLASSRFSDVEFQYCRMVSVNWAEAEWPRFLQSASIRFRECVITESVFFGLSLEGVTIHACKAHSVDFRKAKLQGADMTYTDFTGSQFGGTDLTRADFSEATNYDIDVLNNEIKFARFSRFEAVRLLHGLDVEIVD